MVFLGISMVKNEVDIIEEFVRHNINIFDEMYIIDNRSTDGTREILESLKEEGLPINIWDDFEPAYNQSEKMTAAYYRLKRERKFDYVMVIDADEFIKVNQPEEIRSRLKRQDTKYFLEWELYVPLGTDNGSSCVLDRIVNKAQTNDVFMKVIIPNIKRGEITIWQGNHDIDCIGNTLRKEILPVKLAHFPVRSVDQITSKTICGWFAYLMRGSQSRFSHEGFQWRFIFEKIVKEGIDIDDLSFVAYYYNDITKLTEIKDKKDKTSLKLQYDPVSKLFNKKLYYSNMNRSLSNIILTTEDIIEKYWQNEKELENIKNQHKNNRNDNFVLRKLLRIRDFTSFAINLIRSGRYEEFIYRLIRKITSIDIYERERRNIEKKHNIYRDLYASNFKGRGKIKILYISEKRNLYFETCRYRVFNVIDGLDSSKYDAAVVFLEEIEDDEYRQNIKYADIVIVIRSRYTEKLKEIINYYKQNGAIIGFDIDDCVFDEKVYLQKLGTKNAPYIKEVYESDWAKKYRNEAKEYLDLIKDADFTTSSTVAIMDQIKKYNRNSYVIPNSINRNQLAFSLRYEKRSSNTVNIIYMSGSPTHNEDFGEVENSLFKVLEENKNTKFIVVGYLKLPDHFKRLNRKQVIQYGMRDYLDLLKILSRASINIAPLVPSLFNDCKSELKIFEAALLGIPTIASNTRSYRECITNGHNGYIASTKEDWYVMINKLVKDRRLRDEMGNNARAELVDRFNYLNICRHAMEIYDMIYNNYNNEKIKKGGD